MRIGSATASALQGLQSADAEFTASAGRLAVPFTISLSDEAKAGTFPDVAAEVATQSRAVAAYKANLKSLQTADELTGVLLDLAPR